MPEDAIEALQAQQQAVEFEVWPEVWQVVQAWMAVQTQWRVAPSGRMYGLDYTAVDVALRRRRIADEDGEVFAGLQVMEYAALNALQR